MWINNQKLNIHLIFRKSSKSSTLGTVSILCVTLILLRIHRKNWPTNHDYYSFWCKILKAVQFRTDNHYRQRKPSKNSTHGRKRRFQFIDLLKSVKNKILDKKKSRAFILCRVCCLQGRLMLYGRPKCKVKARTLRWKNLWTIFMSLSKAYWSKK